MREGFLVQFFSILLVLVNSLPLVTFLGDENSGKFHWTLDQALRKENGHSSHLPLDSASRPAHLSVFYVRRTFPHEWRAG